MNPNRKCGMCALLDENVEDVDTQRLAQLAKDLSRETNGMRYDGKIDEETYLSLDKAGLNTLREAANGCPVCVLAAIRQAGIKCHDFSYKTEVGLIFDAMR